MSIKTNIGLGVILIIIVLALKIISQFNDFNHFLDFFSPFACYSSYNKDLNLIIWFPSYNYQRSFQLIFGGQKIIAVFILPSPLSEVNDYLFFLVLLICIFIYGILDQFPFVLSLVLMISLMDMDVLQILKALGKTLEILTFFFDTIIFSVASFLGLFTDM